MGRPGTWGPRGTRERTSPSLWAKPIRWNRLAAEGLLPDGTSSYGRRPRIFCASLADVFEPRSEVAPWRRDLFDLIAATPNLDWLVLTKRPDFAETWLRHYYRAPLEGLASGYAPPSLLDERRWHERDAIPWAVLPNLWIGTSIESTAYTWRADWLRLIPAPVRFISAEPLLGSLFSLPLEDAGGPGEPFGSGAAPSGDPPASSRSRERGEVTGNNRTRPDAAGGTGDVQSAGVGGPGSIPGLSSSVGGHGAQGDPETGSDEPHETLARGLDRDGAGIPGGVTVQPGREGASPDEETDHSIGRLSGSRPEVDEGELTAARGRPAPLDLSGIDWVIVGGESGGRNARPMHPDWAREIRDAVLARSPIPCPACSDVRGSCAEGAVAAPGSGMVPGCEQRYLRPAFHFKQFGSHDEHGVYRGPGPKSAGKLLDGHDWCEFPEPSA